MSASPPHVTIRPIRSEDAEACRELRIEAVQSHPTDFTADLKKTAAHPIDWWRERAKNWSGDGKDVIMLADTGDRLAGMSGVWVPDDGKLAHVGTVWGVYVRPGYRGLGVGQLLLRACIDWARTRRLVTLKLGVTVGNDVAKRCYERCGFETYGVEPLAVQWQGRHFDETLMALRL
jgi:ribosomal protein S18 acetylase RimI-like enzyme